MRTFAIERIRTLALLDEHFETRALPTEPFANSMGVHTGTPEHVQIEFDARVAEYVNERDWHKSQHLDTQPDGSLLMRLEVCDDRPLRSWIHSFGPLARVVAPKRLAQAIFEEIEEARERYMPRFNLDVPRMDMLEEKQRRLPLKTRKWRAS